MTPGQQESIARFEEALSDPLDLGEAALRLALAEEPEVEEPVAVAVDPLGVDVRARFDVLRLPFGTPIEDPERVLDIVANWSRG